MVRAPCCEKMGLKKGPWTPQEDLVLINYISKFGHGNWRALPKQAGLLRCGKSCRLRWTNYLRPDIKRGNFTREEEEMIISLHEMLGNRWSAIAAKLPGRTDNEIKNVWHTHLKKRLSSENDGFCLKSHRKMRCVAVAKGAVESPARSSSDVSSSSATAASSSDVTRESNETEEVKEECLDSSLEGFPEIDESFWSDALSMDYASTDPLDSLATPNGDDDEMSYWLKVFMDAGDSLQLPEI